MAPFNDQFQIRDQLDGANHANGLAGAMGDPIRPGPGARVTIDAGKEVLTQSMPAQAGAINEGIWRGFPGVTTGGGQDRHTEQGHGKKAERTIDHVQDGFKQGEAYSVHLTRDSLEQQDVWDVADPGILISDARRRTIWLSARARRFEKCYNSGVAGLGPIGYEFAP